MIKFILFLVFINVVIFIISLITKTRFLDYYSLSRYKSVLIWLAKKFLHYNNETVKYLTREEIIQYGYRFANCYRCIISGKCEVCGCDAEGRFNSITDHCSDNRWGPFVSKEELDNILLDPKYKLNIKITEEYDSEN